MSAIEANDWRERDGLDRLLDALDASAGATRFVGGVVRDTLLGLPTQDVDLTTRLLPEEAARRIAAAGFKAVPTGIAHGTVTAVLPGGPIEVTTLRRDVATDGRHAKVAFSADWQEDAARRDFTINALSAGPAFGRAGGTQVHDYFGGLADLAARRVRFIGDPLTRIAEDHLRILRFFRFHARFGSGAPDADGLAACIARSNDLMALSRERVADELLKLLALADPAPTITLMVNHAILAPVLPEIVTNGARRLTTLVARERALSVAPAPVRRLAALLPPDPAVARSVAARLRLSNAARERLAAAVDPTLTETVRAQAHAIGIEAATDRWMIHGPEASVAEALALLHDWAPPRLPLKGGALVARGLTAGPRVAATLQRIEQRWVEEGFPPAERVAAIADEEVRLALSGEI